MPNYTVTARGGLLSRTGLVPTGAVVEMSEAAAASLPAGSVERRAAPITPLAPVVVAPPAPVVPTIEAPKTGRKGSKP